MVIGGDPSSDAEQPRLDPVGCPAEGTDAGDCPCHRFADDVVGEVFVVKSNEKTALALVTRSDRELVVGDSFRNRP